EWSRDGDVLVYTEMCPETRRDIWELPLTGDRRPRPLLVTRLNEAGGKVSPDRRWLAYWSDETGRREVYVRPYRGADLKWLVSTQGGDSPWWSNTGRELFYVQDGDVMTVPVSSAGVFRAGAPTVIWHAKPEFVNWDMTADGQRFLVSR